MRLTSPQHGPQPLIPCRRLSRALARALGGQSTKQGLGVTAVRSPSQATAVPTHKYLQEEKDRNIESRWSCFPKAAL